MRVTVDAGEVRTFGEARDPDHRVRDSRLVLAGHRGKPDPMVGIVQAARSLWGNDLAHLIPCSAED